MSNGGAIVTNGAVIVSKNPVVVTAPFDRILPSMTTVLPSVIAALLSIIPAKTLSSPSVSPPAGTQKTLSAFAFPSRKTLEKSMASSVPLILKI